MRINSSAVAGKTINIFEVSRVRYFACESEAQAKELEEKFLHAFLPRFNLGSRHMEIKSKAHAKDHPIFPAYTGEMVFSKSPCREKDILCRIKQKTRHIDTLIQFIEYSGMTEKKGFLWRFTSKICQNWRKKKGTTYQGQ